jgi:hypothetical protein
VQKTKHKARGDDRKGRGWGWLAVLDQVVREVPQKGSVPRKSITDTEEQVLGPGGS